MEELINKYLAYLRVERNSSEHTLLAYKKDLLQLLHFVADESGVDSADVDAEDIERLTIRLWMGELRQKGISRNSIARKQPPNALFSNNSKKEGKTKAIPPICLSFPKNRSVPPSPSARPKWKDLSK